jgi:hypothetical protein
LLDAKQNRGAAYLSVDGVFQRYGGVWSKYQIRRQAVAGMLPHVKLPGRRDILFPLKELERYEAGEVDLEMVRLPKGGRICRPREYRQARKRRA